MNIPNCHCFHYHITITDMCLDNNAKQCNYTWQSRPFLFLLPPFISQDVSQESTQCECNLSNMFTEVFNFWNITYIPLSFSVLAYQKVTERIYFLLASPTNHSMQSCILLHTHQHNQAELLHQAYF